MESVGRASKRAMRGSCGPRDGLAVAGWRPPGDGPADDSAGIVAAGPQLLDRDDVSNSSDGPGVLQEARVLWAAYQSAASRVREELPRGGQSPDGPDVPAASLRGQLAEVRDRESLLKTELEQLRNELQLAAALQRDLLQSVPPDIDGGEISVLHRPADGLSGDLYSTVRLSETEIAISLADATGHGVSAALLSASIGHLLSGSPTAGGNAVDRLEPDEILARVNRVLLDANLEECQFVTALYAIYDEQSRILRWARGGAPYPILVRQGEPARMLTSEGPMVGVSSDARFEIVELALEPGDTVIFHTDGLDSFLLGDSSELGCCDLNSSAWFQTLGEQPIGTQLLELEANLATMSRDDPKADDITIVALQIAEAVTSLTEPVDVRTECLATA